VLIAYGLRLTLGDYSGAYGFLFFILPIVASGLLFDRGTGFFAVALSTILVASLLNWNARPSAHVVALLLFVIVGSCLVLISEGLHRALEAAYAAQRAAVLLLDEMSHRVKNKFAMVSSIINLQARRSTPEARIALEEIARRVNVIATVHDYLQLSRSDGMIDMSEYLPRLCRSLNDALLGPGPLHIGAKSHPVMLSPDKALTIGLIVNELVTNAVKYAFSDGRSGHVQVELVRLPNDFVLTVEDNGRGYKPDAEAGLGTRLVTTLAAQLGGNAVWGGATGCRTTVRFPT